MPASRLLRILCVLLLAVRCLADLAPTLRRWRELQQGQLRHDGVEYFDFEVTEDAFRVFIAVDLGNLRSMEPPTLLIKYGAFPTALDCDQKWLLNDTVTRFTTKIENLRTGHYFVALVGSKLYDSLAAFVGSYKPLAYFMTIWYYGCSDPTRVDTKCSVPLKRLKQIEPPSAMRTNSSTTSDVVYTGCIDGSSSEIYYSLSIPAAVWGLTITLSTQSKYELKIVAGTNLRDPADIKAGNLSSFVVLDAGVGNRSVALPISAPSSGAWMIMVSGTMFQAASCARGTGATFQFVPTYSRNCSSVNGAIITSSNTSVPHLDLCSVSFAPLNEARHHPIKGDQLMDADFEADKPVLGFTARAVAGYVVRFPKRYAGTPLTLTAIVTPNVGPFQIYARVNGYPTMSENDYSFHSSDAGESSQASDDGNSSSGFEGALLYSWSPIAQPRVGTWFILLVADRTRVDHAANDTFWAVDVALHTQACPQENACSGHGKCALVQTYQDLSYGSCECEYGFGGQQCETRTLTSAFRTKHIVLLILSNLAILPVTIVCACRRLYLESVLFFAAGVVSAIYHACDVELFCVFSFRILQQLDFALAFNMVMLLSVHFSGVRKQVKAGIQVFFLLSTIVLAINDATSSTNWVLIGAVCVLQISVTFAYHFAIGSQRLRLGKWAAVKTFLLHSDNFHPRLGVLGLALWAAALVCWLASSFSNYWILHSVWHVSAMLSAACLIAVRRNTRYQMLTPFTAIDVLSPNYNLSPVPLGLKSYPRSKSIQLNNDVESRPTEEGTGRHCQVHCGI